MIPLIIFSETPERISAPLCSALSRFGGVACFYQNGISLTADCARFAVVCAGRLGSVTAPCGALILRDPLPKLPQHENIAVSEGIVPVFLSGSRRARKLLRGCGNAAISCGMSECDTVTLSSVNDNGEALVSLRRNIDTPLGTVGECETQVSMTSRIDSDDIMLVAAALLACGLEPPDGRFLI